LANALKVPQANVRVITDYMGGGFGSKLGQDVQVLIAAKLAKAANAPVKILLDRKTEHPVTGNRPSAYAKVKAGADAQGKFVAWDAETWGTGGAGAGAGVPLPAQVEVWPNRRRTQRGGGVHGGVVRAFRARGGAPGDG